MRRIMITPAWVAMMASYNSEMNRRLYAAAERLTEEARRADRGAFWGSIHGTLSHILWGDMMWMARFDGWEKPDAALRGSPDAWGSFADLFAARQDADARIEAWAARLQPDDLAGETAWFSGAVQRDMRRPTALLVTHLFNHQTHHRGQAHALITAAGEATGDTDLWLIV